MKSSTNRYTPAEKPPISRAALATMASNTGCTLEGELAMTFNISAVAACCSRASFNSLPRPWTEARFGRLAGGTMRRLVVAGLRPLAEPALRVFATLLPPVFDDRAIPAPKSQQSHLIGPILHSGRDERGQNRALPTALMQCSK